MQGQRIVAVSFPRSCIIRFAASTQKVYPVMGNMAVQN
jgi:hypothetical protein